MLGRVNDDDVYVPSISVKEDLLLCAEFHVYFKFVNVFFRFLRFCFLFCRMKLENLNCSEGCEDWRFIREILELVDVRLSYDDFMVDFGSISSCRPNLCSL